MTAQNATKTAGTGQISPVVDEDALDRVFTHPGTTILYLHDPHCPVSARAYREVRRSGVATWLVDVSRARALSTRIEERTGVRHESPQAIVLTGGRPVWSASHGAIRAEVVTRAVSRAEALAGASD